MTAEFTPPENLSYRQPRRRPLKAIAIAIATKILLVVVFVVLLVLAYELGELEGVRESSHQCRQDMRNLNEL